MHNQNDYFSKKKIVPNLILVNALVKKMLNKYSMQTINKKVRHFSLMPP